MKYNFVNHDGPGNPVVQLRQVETMQETLAAQALPNHPILFA